MRTLPMWKRQSCWVSVVLTLVGCYGDSASKAESGASTLTGAETAAPPPNGAGDDGAGDEFTRTLIADLEHKGLRVSQGYPILYSADDCERFTYAASTNCYANNPAAPYVAVVVKPWPDEYIDPTIANVMGGVVPGYTGVYRLDEREAIVVYGRLPPPGRYFSLQSWVYTKEGRWNQKDYDYWAQVPNLAVPIQYLFDTIPPDDPQSTRVQSFSAISNIINNVVIERQSGGSFGQIRYFVVTPDATMDEAVRSALAGLGVSDRSVFTEPIPQRDELGSIGPIGLGREANDFVTFLRYTLPNDPVAGEAWRSELPLTILRVRAPAGTAKPYPLLTFDPRSAVDEIGDAQLTHDFAHLLRSVCDRAHGAPWNLEGSGCEQPPAESSSMKDLVRDYGWTGPYCRSIGMDCLGDQQDAAYFIDQPRPLDDGEIYAVVSTLATKTGNATYSALSVNNASLFKGAANVVDTLLEGSANAYGATVQNPDKLFVWWLARDCDAIAGLTDGKCTTITPEMVPLRNDSAALGDPALHGMFQVGLRDYVKPGTARGPESTHLITPRVLAFKRVASQPYAGPRVH